MIGTIVSALQERAQSALEDHLLEHNDAAAEVNHIILSTFTLKVDCLQLEANKEAFASEQERHKTTLDHVADLEQQ